MVYFIEHFRSVVFKDEYKLI